MNNHLKIAYACDNGYVSYTGISIISLFDNNRDFENITVYLISKGISPANIKILKKICQDYGRSLKVVDFDKIAYDLNISAIGRHIETIYAKIFFSRIEGLDKVFYLDSDTIIIGSLRSLWDIDMTGYCMGMVETHTGEKAKKELGLDAISHFYNDGVALVNVDYSREFNLIEKCLKLVEEYNGNPPVLSEGTLNKVCEGKIKSISLKFNMMAGVHQLIGLSPEYICSKLSYSMDDILDSYKNPVVIHFLSGFYNRPWFKSCTHPLKDKYLSYKKVSPWKDDPLREGKLPLRLRCIGFLLRILGPKRFEKIKDIFTNNKTKS